MALTYLKRGDEAQQLADAAKAAAEARKAEMGKLFRFWLEKGETAEITFVDGQLDPKYKGLGQQPRFFEHNEQINGTWGNHFLCPEKTDPQSGKKCPICAKGKDHQPGLVTLFTIIDHRTITTKKGTIIKDSRKLFVAPSTVHDQLSEIAKALKGPGLMGRRFSVSRSDKPTSARVGTSFTALLDQMPLEQLKNAYIRSYEKTTDGKKEKVTENAFTVADYEYEVPYYTPEELAVKIGAAGAGMYNGSSQSASNVPDGVANQQFEDLL